MACIAAAPRIALRRPGWCSPTRGDRARRPDAHARRHVEEGLVRERGDDAQAELTVGDRGVQRPPERGPKIVELGADLTAPRQLVGPSEERAGSLGEGGVVLGVPAAPRVGVFGLVQALACVRAERLEHRVARGAVGGAVGDDHRLGDQAPERVDDIPALDTRARGDGLGGSRVERAGEDAEPAKTSCSVGENSEYDQSTVARSVWCRSTAVRRPPVRSRNRSSRRATISSGVIATTRAAASSIASGTPSSRRQSSPTAAAVDASSAKPDCTAPARSTNRRAASLRTTSSTPADGSGTGSERNAQMCSPSTARPSRLVARMRTSGDSRSTASAKRAAASRRCSQLSNTSRSVLRTQELADALLDRHARAGLHPEGDRDDLEHGVGIARDRELAHPRADPESPASILAADLNREPRLSDAADSGQRDEPRFTERLHHGRELAVTPHERVELERQIARGDPPSTFRRQRRPARRKPRPLQLGILQHHRRVRDGASASPGSMPSSSPSKARSLPYARSASACRPERYSASINSPHNRSRNGASLTSTSSSPTSSS